MIRLVSVSGGKDSTATLLLALQRHQKEEVMACFADTGNEHDMTYEYVDYLQEKTGVYIHRVKADFSNQWRRRMEYVENKWPEKGVEPDVIGRVLDSMAKGPTGIPFLDLCILKGRFPSTKAAFCTEQLKIYPITNYTLDLIDQHGPVESWQGVRAEESPRRALLTEREDKGDGLTIYRPIHKWTVKDVFAIHRETGTKPNPLYSLGMNRVGCMPCVNCSKGELLEIYKRFPDQIERISEWEKIVGMASKRQASTFFAALGDTETAYERGNIYKQVEWSQTKRGGTKMDIFSVFEEPATCSSSYGLCE